MPIPRPCSSEVSNWTTTFLQRVRADSFDRLQLNLGVRRLRFMRSKVNPPQAYQQFLGAGARIPMTFRLIQTVVGAVAGEERPRWQAIGRDPEGTRRVERWLKLIAMAMERLAQPALYWRYWDALVADGLAVLKTARQPWTDFPQRYQDETDRSYRNRSEEFFAAGPPVPWMTRVLDPMTVFPPLAEWGIPYVVERGYRPADQVMAALGLRPTSTGQFRIAGADEPLPEFMTGLSAGGAARLDVAEIWDKDKMIINVNGQCYEYDNEMGQLPYKWTYASAVAFADPMLQGLSVAFPLLYIEPWINQMASTLIGYANLQSTPTPFTTADGPPGAPATEPQIVDFEAGRMHQFGPGVKPGVFDMGRATESVALFSTLVQLAERFTLSPVPTFAGTRTAGTVLSQVAERVLAILRPLVDQAQVTWSEQGKLWLHLVQNVIKAPVYVSGMSFQEKPGRRGTAAEEVVTPADIKKLTDVQCEIQFKITTDKIAWHSHNVMMHQSGLWSEQRAMLESDVDDPEEEGRRKALERLYNSPAVQAYIMQMGLQGQPPLEALMKLIGGVPAIPGGPAPNGAPGAGGGAPNGANPRPAAGAVEGVPRAPGGTRSSSGGRRGRTEYQG